VREARETDHGVLLVYVDGRRALLRSTIEEAA
jgi:hypothetical protein